MKRAFATAAGVGLVGLLAMPAAASTPATTPSTPSTTTPSTTSSTSPATTAPASTTPVTVAGSTPGTTSGTPDTTPGTTPGTGPATTLTWASCTDEDARGENVECATLTVPLDYDDPAGETIDLALVRAPFTRLRRQGAVLFNPGGPGGSGFTAIARNGPFIQSSLGITGFDLVGFDPRGVDRSGGLKCVDDKFLDDHLYLDDTPDNLEEFNALNNEDDEFATACHAKYGDTLRFYSTANTARDMDAIRAAMGDEKVSYLGISYGTYLGAVYATMFPDRVKAMVLDSAYEPNDDTPEQDVLTQIVGFEGAFNNWAKDCQTNTKCPFNSDDVVGAWKALRERLDLAPLTVDGREVNQVVMERATISGLYSKSEWPAISDAMAQAEDGDGSGLLALADSYSQRDPDGTYASIRQSNPIIHCASGFEGAMPDDVPALLGTLVAEAPVFAGRLTLEELERQLTPTCAALVGKVEQTRIQYSGDAPILVVGGRNDPATPFRWATELDAAMGPSSRLLEFTGEGHGQLLSSKCVTEWELTTLTGGDLPEDGTTCEPDPAVERPDFWASMPVPVGIGDVKDLPSLASALGLSESDAFWESRLTDLDPEAAIAAYEKAFTAAGHNIVGRPDIGVAGTAAVTFEVAPGEAVVFVAVGPEAFAGDLAGGKVGVPDGSTAVLIVWFPST